MDLGDPDLYRDETRFASWRAFVAEDAVVFSEPGASPSGFWSVFSHRACRQVLAAGGPFTSEYGMLIGFDADHPDRGGGKMIVATDGPAHTRLRRILGRFLSPGELAGLGRFIDDEIGRQLAVLRSSGDAPVDVATGIGPRLPAAVVCQLLGVPQSDRDELIRLTDSAFASPDSDSSASQTADAHTEIFFYFHDRIEQCRRSPGSDLISALLTADGLSTDEVLANCYNLLIGGNQTSRHLITGAFLALARHPVLPADGSRAVDELARWLSPGMHVLRVATDDVNVSGRRIRRGEAVVAWLAAANRDPAVFDAPGELRWDRAPNPHLSFGHGVHHCMGAQLARMEAGRLLTALARQTAGISCGEPVTTRSNLIQGFRSLPVSIDWRASVPV
ncbi:cytochrome P450 [Actinoplanes sp. L3-i22]|uniref:cytochrome P450 n=1 Tax=Actinoplanes sp. L3-i22 TaxID=2836373 RepID=UPI001C78B3A3|nr:cytochrome P450 [Actinoplanes sp. L3-i22]BCY09063.1 cytochrome P450 [Actinoplanes sp. L3-i22]